MSKEKKEKIDYKVIIYDETHLREVASYNVTSVNVIATVGLVVILVAALVTVLLVYTPLNSLLPNTTENRYRDEVVDMAMKIDSLEQVIVVRADYFRTIGNLMDGKVDTDNPVTDTVIERQKIDFVKNKHDSILQSLIEEQEHQTLSAIGDNGRDKFRKMTFFMPVKGTITAPFDVSIGHLGVDIATKGDEPILATLPGTVILATWSVETGHVIQLQHDNNIVSIYKHCAALHKSTGDKVEAGEPIAIVGNSGDLTSGTHLHFELWHNGVPVDPAQYIAY